MILGAGPLQVPAIKKAKEYKMHVCVCDYDKNAEGFLFADEALLISTTDKDAVLEAAKKRKPDYILTSTSDAPVRTVAYVCEKLGMAIDISYEDAICATDKSFMRKRMKAHDLPIPSFFVCSNYDEFKKAISKFEEKCVVKPADSAASRGVELFYSTGNEECIKQQYVYTKSYSRSGIVVVEEFMEGPEVSVECIVLDRKVFILAITDKMICELPFFVETGHSEPSGLPTEVKKQIEIITTKAIAAIGIINGCAHAELKVTKSGPKIVEVAARLGGDFITSKLVPLSTGVDMVGASLAIAMRKPVNIEVKKNRGSAIRFLHGKKGILQYVKVESGVYDIPGVEEVTLYCRPGDKTNDLHSSNDRLGYIITSGATAEEAILAAEKAMSKIELVIE